MMVKCGAKFFVKYWKTHAHAVNSGSASCMLCFKLEQAKAVKLVINTYAMVD